MTLLSKIVSLGAPRAFAYSKIDRVKSFSCINTIRKTQNDLTYCFMFSDISCFQNAKKSYIPTYYEQKSLE